MKRFLSIICSVIAFLIVFLLLNRYLSERFDWKSTAHHEDISPVVGSIEPQGTENVSYKPKYEYAVGYLKDTLGGDLELSDYIVIVDISEQTEYVFDENGDLVNIYRISTGERDTEKQMGKSIWRVSSKIGYEVAPLYGPRMMMLDRYFEGEWIETTIALHGTEEPGRIGTPFTLGCVYHNNADIIALFDILEVGNFVVAIE